ncbi:AbfB domain-containing protein [Kibdelosporangium philippinense]|uniref:AbfB domain-containing protein n=1 Tax=Kibdelosporangium philippinense TaxID=211113 RepID=A0ABS8ZK30_9PSEU|nr:AbfB domain-containing protein [Kibdelosporangium philippinense]MCE7008136.1 AbfB domain-containing protein [Kibdelosporangium philippinense]
MRSATVHSRRFARGLVAAAVVTGLMAPVAAHAAPSDIPPAAASRNSEATANAPAIPQIAADPTATAVPESTEVEKVRAVRAIEVGEATDEWLMLSDKNFVFRVYDKINADKYPYTKAEAYRVYKIVVEKPDAPDATAFIRTNIHDFVDRDHLEYARRQEEARKSREDRQKAAAFAEIAADAAMLDGNDQNFVYQVWRRSTGPKVKDGAMTAWGGDAAAWKKFIATDIFTLHIADQRDAIEKAKQESEEAARILAAKQAKKNAAAVLGIVVPDGWLVLSDDNFIRQLLTTPELANPRHIEVRNAAEAALRSTNPADWKAFIDTGLKAADARDAKREQDIREEADRKKVRDIKAKAEASLVRPRLVAAANAALAGTAADVTKFLSETQYNVLTQSIMATTAATAAKGWYLRSGGGDAVITPGSQGDTVADAPLGEASWKIVPGLADENCFSLESTTHAGSFVRHQDYRVKLHANDGTDLFKGDATWCAKPGLEGAGIALEAKNVPGRFMRHINGEVWLANDSGQFDWDTPTLFKPDATWAVVDPDPAISTHIQLRWLNDDALRAFVGTPKAAEVLVDGIRYREYANNARIYWGKDTGVRSVSGEALTKFLASGGHKLRMPIIDTTRTPDGKGTYTHFASKLSIYWTPDTGAHLIYGAIYDRWAAMDWERSYLGYPKTDEEQVGNLRRSTFQGGYIYHDPATGRTWDTRF